MKKQKEKIKDVILNKYEKGNIVVSTIKGLQTMPLDEFVKQPVEGMLYDLNRDELVILTFIDDPKWINDFASTKVIRKLAFIAEKRDAIIEALEELVKLQASYGKIGDIMELRQKIETLKKEIQ